MRASSPPLPVTLYSDFICPYCYIAERVLARVARRHPLDITWIGYEIHPELPQAGASALFLGEAFGEGLWQRVEALAAQLGVPIRAPRFLPNTHLALEAAEFARERGKILPFHEEVFSAYFERGANIGEHAVLRDAAGRVGLDPGELSMALDERVYFDTVEESREKALGDLVTVVPTAVLGGVRVVGAQSEEAFEAAIAKAKERMDRMPRA